MSDSATTTNALLATVRRLTGGEAADPDELTAAFDAKPKIPTALLEEPNTPKLDVESPRAPMPLPDVPWTPGPLPLRPSTPIPLPLKLQLCPRLSDLKIPPSLSA